MDIPVALRSESHFVLTTTYRMWCAAVAHSSQAHQESASTLPVSAWHTTIALSAYTTHDNATNSRRILVPRGAPTYPVGTNLRHVMYTNKLFTKFLPSGALIVSPNNDHELSNARPKRRTQLHQLIGRGKLQPLLLQRHSHASNGCSQLNTTRGSVSVYLKGLGPHALGHKGAGLGTFLPKTRLEQGGFKDTTLNY